ncbi:hypothetical protein [Jeotgalibacillus soli]|uniref:Small-conductance mechanosensitive channel n=1 Tax=Jeotgalibacillus soli TaxID=889306 RepID=A0A0C2R1U6_9BACL|nr:hypothetical protein [Jeotgalibacillus soli]KIL44290.1 hypothetical protein KP78_32540 [Jeotgalibacillus soli]
MAMKKEIFNQTSIELSQSAEMEAFHSRSHFWGRLTLWVLIAASLMAPLYLSFVLGAHPGWTPIIAGLVGYAAFVGIMWVLEPVTYYPTLGISGTYIGFLTGNIANMCLPCSAAAQNAVGAEPGTKKAEISGTLGIAIASLTNIIVIIFVVLSGSYIVSILPAPVETALGYVLPAIFGGVLGQFAIKVPLYGTIALIVGLIILFSPIFSLIQIVLCVVITVAIVLYIEKLKASKE